jgi:hypothetical protein
MRATLLMLPLLLTACGGKADDSAAIGTPTLTITAPVDGAWLDLGAEATLSAVGRDAAGAVIDTPDLAWSTGDWAVEGNDLVVTDLPAGNHVLEAQVLIGGAVVSDSVEISVFAPSRR